MDLLQRSITQFVVLCWTASNLTGKVTNSDQTGNDSHIGQASSQFFYQSPVYPRDCEEVKDQCSSTISSGVYLIKPDGYPQPFEVYCDNRNSEPWTVICRRLEGSLDFNREWRDCNVGFGFLSQEFWIGNEKLSFLTNQKKYRIRIDITNNDGSSCYVIYNLFRISDEYSSYKLSSIGDLSGNVSDCIDLCPYKREPGDCSCQPTCQDPHGCHDTCTEDDTCICSEGFYLKGDDCVTQEQCGCYYSLEGVIIPEGDFKVDTACARRSECNNGQLINDDSYRCSTNAVCEERNNVRQCYCMPGYRGDGVTCNPPYADCQEIFDSGDEDSGVYTISPPNWPGSPFEVYCNMTDGGGWTTFQRRVDGTVDFYRNWTSYKEGFGSPDHEFWLGNDKLYYLTNQERYTIRIDLVNTYGSPYYAEFDFFRITKENDECRLSEVGSYSGTADTRASTEHYIGYALTYHHTYQFSTYDRGSSYGCASYRHGAWWYRSCTASNLNGDYHGSGFASINWNSLPGSDYNIKFTEMKLRPFS